MSDIRRHKNSEGARRTAFLPTGKTPRVRLEPTSSIQQGAENKALTEDINPVLATSLDKTLQKYPDLAQLVKVWPELPEHTKKAIKTLVQTHKSEKK